MVLTINVSNTNTFFQKVLNALGTPSKKKREKFGDFAQKEGGGQFQNPNIFTLKLGHFIEEGGGQSKNSQIF